MNPSIHPSQHVTTLRQTHRAATTLLPVLTATLTVAGAVIAAMEARAPRVSDEPRAQTPDEAGDEADHLAPAARHAAYRASRVTVRGYIATLAGRLLMVTLGIALVFALVYLASATGRVGQAILLTTLILLTLYLTEKVTRRR